VPTGAIALDFDFSHEKRFFRQQQMRPDRPGGQRPDLPMQRRFSIRVTRCIFLEVAPNVAQTIFFSKLLHNFSSPKSVSTFVIYKKTTKVNNLLNTKIRQSGHPVLNADSLVRNLGVNYMH
jgi:hypothetical protein